MTGLRPLLTVSVDSGGLLPGPRVTPCWGPCDGRLWVVSPRGRRLRVPLLCSPRAHLLMVNKVGDGQSIGSRGNDAQRGSSAETPAPPATTASAPFHSSEVSQAARPQLGARLPSSSPRPQLRFYSSGFANCVLFRFPGKADVGFCDRCANAGNPPVPARSEPASPVPGFSPAVDIPLRGRPDFGARFPVGEPKLFPPNLIEWPASEVHVPNLVFAAAGSGPLSCAVRSCGATVVAARAFRMLKGPSKMSGRNGIRRLGADAS